MTKTAGLAGANTAARILAAAAEIMADKGVKGATTRAIATAAGVNEVTIFRLFGTKEGLLAAVLESLFPERTGDAPLAALLGRPTAGPEELRILLVEFGTIFYERFLEENRTLINIFLRSGTELPRKEDILYSRLTALADLLARRFERISDGIGDSSGYGELAYAWLAALVGIHFVRDSSDRTIMDPAQLNRLFAGIITERVYAPSKKGEAT